jgi:hypothetical protein
MEKFPKIRFIVVTILVITLINIGALAFILRHSFNEHRREKPGDKKEFAKKGFDFLKEKLALTSEQEVLFRNERDSFFAAANSVFDELEEKRMEMIHEFAEGKPDTAVLYRIAAEMGKNHGDLKKHVVDHLLKLRSYSSSEQLVKLDSMYNIMIRTDSPWRNKKGGDLGKDRNTHNK